MINTNIINSLNPHDKINNQDISFPYFIIIESAKEKTECNQDYLELNLIQVNDSITNILNNNDSIFRKKLSITGVLELDENDLYYSKLIGFESENSSPQENNTYTNISHHIEIIETQLNKTINIEFSEKYLTMPSIIVNIEKQYESLYRSYSIEYKKNNKEEYIGVNISFNNLKTKNLYPEIKITIIGDENPNYQPTEETEPTNEPEPNNETEPTNEPEPNNETEPTNEPDPNNEIVEEPEEESD